MGKRGWGCMFRRVVSRALFVLLLCLHLTAETVAPVSIEALGHEAELVVHAEVEETSVRRDSERRIITEVRLRVTEVWAGDLDERSITLVHPGGVLGEVGTFVSGQPQYDPGEEVVLFLRKSGSRRYVTVGLGNGKFTVREGVARNDNTEPRILPLVQLRELVRRK